MSPAIASPISSTATPATGVAPFPAAAAEIPDLADRLDAALPQTQCTRCGFPDCRGYAQALAEGRADIDQCPPGGAQGIARLAAILRRPTLPLNETHGQEGPRQVVFVDERACIGCTLCIQACPVDAIIGAPKRMHVVIEEACTGCERCMPVCPVDCLVLENASGSATGWDAWSAEQAAQARERYGRHVARVAASAPPPSAGDERPLEAGSMERDLAPAASPLPSAAAASDPPSAALDKKAAIEAALARARLRAKMRAP